MADIEEKIKVTADTSDADKATRRLGDTMAGSFGKALIAVEALKAGLNLVKNAVTESVGLALEYEKTTLALQAALRGQGLEAESTSRAFEAQAAAMQKLTGIGDEEIRRMQTLAINYGIAVDKVDDFVRASITLANTAGTSVESAMRQLAKTTGGYAGELGELIPEVRNMTAEQLALGGAIDVVNEKWSENLDLLTQGRGGQVVGLTNAWRDFNEAIGVAILNTDALGGSVGTATKLLENLATVMRAEGFLAAVGSFADQMFNAGEGTARLLDHLEGLQDPALIPLVGTEKRRTPTKTRPGRLGPVSEFMPSDAIIGGMPAAPDPDRIRQLVEMVADADRMIADERERIRISNLERLNDLEIKETEFLREQEEERLRIAEDAQAREMEMREKFADIATGIAGGLANTLVNAALDAAEGQEVAFDQVLKGFLRSTGQSLVGQGIMDVMKGISRAITSYGFDPTAAALVAHGGVEIAAGTAMAAGSLAIPAANTGSAGGDFAGGSAASAPDAGPQLGGNTVTINVMGAITPAESAVLLERARSEAREQGFNI